MTSINLQSGKLAANPPDAEGVWRYKGIPYAAPPVGDLRWKPPQDVVSWTGVRPSNVFGSNAPQRIVFSDIDPYAAGVSEDCLYVNVWTPAAPGDDAKLPVLFWIHGGGFAVGSGAEPRYDGARLSAMGTVVVTVNTRLNALGLMAHPELTAESEHKASGNFATLDLIAALQWVKNNIASFGGDSGAVTIAGESAGSMFVSMLMASPLAKGLFHRAIGESGAQFPSPEKPMLPLAEAEGFGLGFMRKLGVSALAEMRALPVEALLEASPGLGFWPVTDGYVLPQNPADIFAAGLQNDVPLLAGWNKDEGTNFNIMDWSHGRRSYRRVVEALMREHSGEALRLYPDKSDARALGGDLIINHGTWAWLEAQRKSGKADIFRYQFNRGPKTPASWFPKAARAGAFHSCEIPYVFKTLDCMPWNVNANDWHVADMTAGYWVNFVKSGNPNGSGLQRWPSYRDGERAVMHINVKPNVTSNTDVERHTFLARVTAQR